MVTPLVSSSRPDDNAAYLAPTRVKRRAICWNCVNGGRYIIKILRDEAEGCCKSATRVDHMEAKAIRGNMDDNKSEGRSSLGRIKLVDNIFSVECLKRTEINAMTRRRFAGVLRSAINESKAYVRFFPHACNCTQDSKQINLMTAR